MKTENDTYEGDLRAENGKTYTYKKITGRVIVDENVEAAFPNLETVGGYVAVYGSLDAPKLETVGGEVAVSGSGKLDAPKSMNKNDNTAAPKCREALLKSFSKKGFSFSDGILARVVSKRGPVTRVVVCGKTEVSFVVTDGENNSHGKTLKEARDGLLYKIGNRDTSEFKKWTLKTVVTKRDAVRAYRAITGACESGVRLWFEKQGKTPEKTTVQRVVDLTAGAYGNEVFKGFFENK